LFLANKVHYNEVEHNMGENEVCKRSLSRDVDELGPVLWVALDP